MGKLSVNNKIEVVSEAFKVALGAILLAGLLYFIDEQSDFLKTLDISKEDVVMIGAAATGFCILWIILDKWFFGPYLRLFERREALTKGAAGDVEKKQTEIAEMLEQYEIKTLEARSAALKERAEAVSKAKAEAQKKIEAAKTSAQQALAEAKADYVRKMRELEAQAERESEVLADQMVAKVLQKGAN